MLAINLGGDRSALLLLLLRGRPPRSAPREQPPPKTHAKELVRPDLLLARIFEIMNWQVLLETVPISGQSLRQEQFLAEKSWGKAPLPLS